MYGILWNRNFKACGATIEANYNNEIMKWPKSIAPFDVVIIVNISKNNKENFEKAEKVYKELKKTKY